MRSFLAPWFSGSRGRQLTYDCACSGGLELLFNNQKHIEVDVPADGRVREAPVLGPAQQLPKQQRVSTWRLHGCSSHCSRGICGTCHIHSLVWESMLLTPQPVAATSASRQQQHLPWWTACSELCLEQQHHPCPPLSPRDPCPDSVNRPCPSLCPLLLPGPCPPAPVLLAPLPPCPPAPCPVCTAPGPHGAPAAALGAVPPAGRAARAVHEGRQRVSTRAGWGGRTAAQILALQQSLNSLRMMMLFWQCLYCLCFSSLCLF